MNKYIIGAILGVLISGQGSSSLAAQNLNLPGFKHHQTIYIQGGSEELSSYPVMIRLGGKQGIAVKSEADFRDIRFVDSEQAPLSYYLQERIFSGIAAQEVIFWVKIPKIPREGTTIRLYSGNKNAQDESDGNKVFPFFDDFSATELNKEKWVKKCELKGSSLIEGGGLKLNDCEIISRNFKMKKGVLEFQAKAEKNCAIQAIVKGRLMKYSTSAAEQIIYSSAYPGAEHAIAVDNIARVNVSSPIEPFKKYIYKVILNDDGINFERYSQNAQKEAEVRFLDVANFDEGYIGLRTAGTFLEEGNANFYWVRVRPYVNIEPKVGQ